MKKPHLVGTLILLLITTINAERTNAQGTAADYERAATLKARYEAAAIDIVLGPTWIGNTNRLFYRKLSRGATEFVVFDAQTLQKRPAFDHEKIAAALSRLTGNTYKPQDLQSAGLRFDEAAANFNATIDNTSVRCTISDSACVKVDNPGRGLPTRPQGPVVSPDKKWEALVNNYNIAVRAVGSRDLILLSTDGSEGNYYDARSIVWSPDSTKIAALSCQAGLQARSSLHRVVTRRSDAAEVLFNHLRQTRRCARSRTTRTFRCGCSKTANQCRQRTVSESVRDIGSGLAERQSRHSRLNTINVVIRSIA